MSKENTEVKELSPEALTDLLLQASGADKVSSSGPKHIFSSTDFSEPKPENHTEIVEDSTETDTPAGTEETVIDDALLNTEEDDDPIGEDGGSKPAKASVRAIEALIKDGHLKEFDGEKPLNQYTDKELSELLLANLKEKDSENKESALTDLYENSHSMVQYLLSYQANGGKDVEKIIKHLAGYAQVKELDVKSEAGQEQIVRTYLGASDDMTPEEIEEEITSLKDRKELEKKAAQYQPKLEAKRLQDAQKQLKLQEDVRKREEQAMAKINETVIATLKKGELAGIKIDPNTQSMIYQDLMGNGAINTIGTLVKQMGIEPDMATVGKFIWFLRDQEGFEKAIKNQEKKEGTENTIRQLKTTGASGKTGSTTIPTTSTPTRTNTIKRPAPNPFGVKK